MMKFFDLRQPFFLPTWRRAATVGVLGLWTLVEVMGGNTGWAILFGAICAYCTYEFFIAFDPANYQDRED